MVRYVQDCKSYYYANGPQDTPTYRQWILEIDATLCFSTEALTQTLSQKEKSINYSDRYKIKINVVFAKFLASRKLFAELTELHAATRNQEDSEDEQEAPNLRSASPLPGNINLR